MTNDLSGVADHELSCSLNENLWLTELNKSSQAA